MFHISNYITVFQNCAQGLLSSLFNHDEIGILHPFYNLNFTILILQSYTDCRKSLHVKNTQQF